ncbi:integrase core domain-containing protein [Paracoccus jeotgali]|uniref:integrase core domain-containing protein n=1 Tax=Paracoccus jeotgali TaxID=2065379 RepID=UPI0035E4579B
MDGRGQSLDNVFIERPRRSLKCECLYLHAWETGSETKAAIPEKMVLYNYQHPHLGLGGKPPALVDWQRNDIGKSDQQCKD